MGDVSNRCEDEEQCCSCRTRHCLSSSYDERLCMLIVKQMLREKRKFSRFLLELSVRHVREKRRQGADASS